MVKTKKKVVKRPSPEQLASGLRQATKDAHPTGATEGKSTVTYSKKQYILDSSEKPTNTTLSKNKKHITEKLLINEEYVHAFMPMMEKVVRRLTEEGYKYFEENDDALTLQQFYVRERITPRIIETEFKKYPFWVEFIEYAKMIIAMRREYGGLTKKYDSGLVRWTAPLYSAEMRRHVEWQASLKEKVAAAGRPSVVMVETPSYYNTVAEGSTEVIVAKKKDKYATPDE